MTLHEELPAILLAAAFLSVGIVIFELASVSASLQTLRALAGVMPAGLRVALQTETAALDMPEPTVT